MRFVPGAAASLGVLLGAGSVRAQGAGSSAVPTLQPEASARVPEVPTAAPAGVATPVVVTPVVVVAPPPPPPAEAERQGGRVGVSIQGGFAPLSNSQSGASETYPVAGVALRFGGAFTDRFHLLGEFTLHALPGSTTGFQGALDFEAQGFIGPRFWLRGGVGVAELVGFAGSSFYYALPGVHVVGALGYDVHRQGERSIAIEAVVSYSFLNGRPAIDRALTAVLGIGFDFY